MPHLKPVLLAVLLAGVIAFGAGDLLLFSGQPSTPAASAGGAETTLAAQPLPAPMGCWVPGDLIGDANPAAIRCAP
jgi:hypothetical protein